MVEEPTPPHLFSTLRLVARAYPEGVPPPHYLPLLHILSEHMSDENLAIVASYWNKGEGPRLDDVYHAQEEQPMSPTVMKKLHEAGFSTWAEEE